MARSSSAAVTQEATPRPSGMRRSLLQVLLDAVVARKLKMPKATHRYRTIKDLDIPMRDGVRLKAVVLLPTGRSKGTLLTRSPYGWGVLNRALFGAPFARQGYTVVLAGCRGTFGSGGDFKPLRQEREDGADTVEWLRHESWFTGTFATFGGSYAAYTQWAIMAEAPPELATAIISTTCHDFGRGIYRSGAFGLDAWFTWSERMVRQERYGLLRTLIADRKAALAVPNLQRGLPLLQTARKAFAGEAPWYQAWLSHRDLSDPFWDSYDSSDALERVEVPILIEVGWQDPFLDQGIEEVMVLQRRGVEVALTAGPWTHRGVFIDGGDIVTNEAVGWLDQHLAGHTSTRTAPVRAFINGANQWVDLPSWPPPAEDFILFPTQQGALDHHPGRGNAVAKFTYDPTDPTPTIGGPLMTAGGGYVDDTELSARPDVLHFTSAPLSEQLRIFGTPRVVLAHESDNRYSDVFIRLSRVDGMGRSQNVSEGFVRLDATSVGGPVELELDPTGQEFEVGDRIRLIVAGGSFPRWERNLGTGEDPSNSARMAPSTRTITLDQSQLVLPVVRDAGP